MADILILGMDKPKSCNACMFDAYGLCLINKYIEAEDELTHDCPLVELPEHGDLIDRNELCDGLVSNHPVVIYAKTAPVVVPSNKEVGYGDR